jgi:glyoxylase-like metal-dependent hydrolase (beta-lactamase superfamily II)
VIVSGEHDAILVDAQFGKAQAEQVVSACASGKHLTTIYISHGDPDYYFGLDTLTQAFPEAKVLASAATVAHIRQTMDAKLAYWGPQMGADKPAAGRAASARRQQPDAGRAGLEVVGLDGPQPDRSFVWIPSIKAVVGGVVVSEHIHVWMADTQTAQSHADWLATLARIEALAPRTVVPGTSWATAAVRWRPCVSPTTFVTSMPKPPRPECRRTDRGHEKALPEPGRRKLAGAGAKVAKGEMKW